MNPEIFIATPMYGGQNDAIYLISMLGLQRTLLGLGIQHRVVPVVNQSLISRARNRMVAAMRKTEATHILWWDADIGMNPEHVRVMLAINQDVVAAPCTRKELNLDNMKAAILANPDITHDQMLGCAGGMNFTRQALGVDTKELPLDRPVEVLDHGTGIMLIRRRVFDLLEKHYPNDWYYDSYAEDRSDTDKVWDFFPNGIDFESRTYLSEDYAFCRRWAKIGGKVHTCPWIQAQHAGRFVYTGNVPDIAECLMKTKSTAA